MNERIGKLPSVTCEEKRGVGFCRPPLLDHCRYMELKYVRKFLDKPQNAEIEKTLVPIINKENKKQIEKGKMDVMNLLKIMPEETKEKFYEALWTVTQKQIESLRRFKARQEMAGDVFEVTKAVLGVAVIPVTIAAAPLIIVAMPFLLVADAFGIIKLKEVELRSTQPEE